MAGGGAQIMPSPDSTQVFYHGKAIKGPSPQAQRSSTMLNCRQDLILRIHKGWTNTLSTLSELSHESHQPCLSRSESHQGKSPGATLWITCQANYGVSQGMGHITECRGGAGHGCRELTMGSKFLFRRRTKSSKREGLRWFGEEHVRENEQLWGEKKASLMQIHFWSVGTWEARNWVDWKPGIFTG